MRPTRKRRPKPRPSPRAPKPRPSPRAPKPRPSPRAPKPRPAPHARPGDILVQADRIAARVRGLGAELARFYAGREPVLVAVMKGSVLFLADLVRAWPGAMDLEFVTARLYEGSEPRRLQLALPPGLREVVAGRPVLVVDDIFDTGRTLTAVCEAVERLGPADLRTLVFLKKKRRRRPKALLRRLDWVGFEVPDRFVVGYGLDYGGRFRNLPYVAVFAEA